MVWYGYGYDMLPLPTAPVWWGSMDAISSYRGNRPTNTRTNTQTDRGDYNTLRRSFASAQCNERNWGWACSPCGEQRFTGSDPVPMLKAWGQAYLKHHNSCRKFLTLRNLFTGFGDQMDPVKNSSHVVWSPCKYGCVIPSGRWVAEAWSIPS